LIPAQGNPDTGASYEYVDSDVVKGATYFYKLEDVDLRSAFVEEFVNIEGRGGIAAWSPTGLGYPSWHESLAEALYEVMFGDYVYQLGPATTIKPGGGLLTYTLTYANHGNQPAENVVLTEVYDPHTLFDSASAAPSSGDNVWQLGTLAPSESGTIAVTVRVLEDVPLGTIVHNQARLSSDNLDDVLAAVNTSVGSRAYLPLIVK